MTAHMAPSLPAFLALALLVTCATSQTAPPALNSTGGPPSSKTPGTDYPPCSTSNSNGYPGYSSGSPPSSTSTTSSNTCPGLNGITTQVASRLANDTLNSAGLAVMAVLPSGCPNRAWSSQTTPNSAMVQTIVWSFPSSPIIAATPLYVSLLFPNGTTNPNRVMGAIGLALDGLAIFNDADADGADAYLFESQTFDQCRSHVAPGGSDHYHSEPAQGCVFNDTTGRHSPMFGVMADGIPVFGALGDNGAVPTNLDGCRGHVDTSYPYYHYHVTFNLTAPYIVTCLMGCIVSQQGNFNLASHVTTKSSCVPSATQYDYSSMVIPWIGATQVSNLTQANMSSTSSSSTSGGPPSYGGPPAMSGGPPSYGGPPSMSGGPPSYGGPPSSSSPCESHSRSDNDPHSGSAGNNPGSNNPGSNNPGSSNPGSNSPASSKPADRKYLVRKLRTVLNMDYNALMANVTRLGEFKTAVIHALCSAAGVPDEYCTIASLTAGSVIAATDISYPTDLYTDAQASASSTAASSSSNAFSAAFLAAYGVSGQPSSTDVTGYSNSSPMLSTGAIIGIAIGGFAGVALIIVGAVLIAVKMKKKGSNSSSQPGTQQQQQQAGPSSRDSPTKGNQVRPEPEMV